MKIDTVIFTAAGQQHTFTAGNFFQILALDVGTVQVEFLKNQTTLSDEGGDDAPEGYVANLFQNIQIPGENAFDGVRVTSNAAQTITVGISKGVGGLNKFTGNVIVTNALLKVERTDLERKIPSGATPYYRHTASGALNTVVTPGANLNGVRIYQMHAAAYSINNRIMYKSSAPASFGDTSAFTLLHSVGGGGSNSRQENILAPLPLDIPAGVGLYEQASGGGSDSMCSLIYEVL